MEKTHLQEPLFVFLIGSIYIFLNRKLISSFYQKLKTQKDLQLAPVQEKYIEHVAIIYMKDNCTIALDHSNQFVSWDYNTLKASMQVLSPDRYFMIRRDMIIDALLIERVLRENGRLMLKLKEPFNQRFLVSKKRSPAFRIFVSNQNLPYWNNVRKTFS